MPDPALRASDDDRERVVAALERHTAAGRLSLDEFAERVSLVYAASTHGDLAGVTRDLPADPTASGHRQLLLAFMIAAITLVVLGVVLALFR
jgi:Domain of unknown function (DUF1707)